MGRIGGTTERDRQPDEDARWALLDRISGWLDQPMALLALAWLVLLLAEALGLIAAPLSGRFGWLDIIIWLAFLGQFLLELAIAPRRLSYLRHHWITALSVVVPFFRVLRLVRAVRALRSLSLLRIALGANRATSAAGLFLGRHGFQYISALVLIVTLTGAIALYLLERGQPGSQIDSFGTALWWSATMMTTINIGIDPVTPEGRLVGVLMRLLALSLFGYVTATIASFFIGREVASRGEPTAITAEDLRSLRRELEALQHTIASLRQRVEGTRQHGR